MRAYLVADNKVIMTENSRLTQRIAGKPSAPEWTVTDAGITLIVMAIALLLIGSVVTLTLDNNPTAPQTVSLLIGWMVGLIITAIFVVVRWRRDKSQFDALWGGQSQRPLIVALVIGVGAAFTVDLVAAIGAGVLNAERFLSLAPLAGLSGDIGQLVIAALFLLVALPLADSLVFFGVIQPRLRASYGGWIGLLATAVLYAGLWYLVYGARLSGGLQVWYGFIAPLLLGLTLGVMRIWTGTLVGVLVTYLGITLSALVVLIAF